MKIKGDNYITLLYSEEYDPGTECVSIVATRYNSYTKQFSLKSLWGRAPYPKEVLAILALSGTEYSDDFRNYLANNRVDEFWIEHQVCDYSENYILKTDGYKNGFIDRRKRATLHVTGSGRVDEITEMYIGDATEILLHITVAAKELSQCLAKGSMLDTGSTIDVDCKKAPWLFEEPVYNKKAEVKPAVTIHNEKEELIQAFYGTENALEEAVLWLEKNSWMDKLIYSERVLTIREGISGSILRKYAYVVESDIDLDIKVKTYDDGHSTWFKLVYDRDQPDNIKFNKPVWELYIGGGKWVIMEWHNPKITLKDIEDFINTEKDDIQWQLAFVPNHNKDELCVVKDGCIDFIFVRNRNDSSDKWELL